MKSLLLPSFLVLLSEHRDLPALFPPVKLASDPACLNLEEQQHLQTLRNPQSSRRYFLTRLLVRYALSLYVHEYLPEELGGGRELPLNGWEFTKTSLGKPQLLAPKEYAFLRFNVSHTAGLTGCFIHPAAEVGLDIEDTRRQLGDLPALVKRYCSLSEQEMFNSLAAVAYQQRQHFFAYWTLKEAYLKALGRGLRLPLQNFSFALSALPGAGVTTQITLTLTPKTLTPEEVAAPTEFRLWQPLVGYQLALSAVSLGVTAGTVGNTVARGGASLLKTIACRLAVITW